MKVTVYTTSTCPFSKQEREFLQSRNVVFEEKNVETNREWLNELLTVSSNFAGTPVTQIVKDDGQTVVLKGFTQADFENVLGPAVQAQQPPAPEPPTPQPTPPQPAPEPPVSDTPPPAPPVPEPTPPAPEPPMPSPETPQTPPVSEPPKPQPATPQQTQPNDALDAILKDLQNKVNEAYSTQDKPGAPAPKPVDKPVPQPTPNPEPPVSDTPPPPTQQPPSPQQPSVPDFK